MIFCQLFYRQIIFFSFPPSPFFVEASSAALFAFPLKRLYIYEYKNIYFSVLRSKRKSNREAKEKVSREGIINWICYFIKFDKPVNGRRGEYDRSWVYFNLKFKLVEGTMSKTGFKWLSFVKAFQHSMNFWFILWKDEKKNEIF